MINSSLITTTIKTLLVEIKNLRYNLTKIFEISFTNFTNYHSNVSIVVSIQRKTANSFLENVIQTFLITIQNEISIILIDKVEFFELFASSEKSEISFTSKQIFLETKNISSKALSLNQKLDTSQISLSNDRLIHQTSKRVQSSNKILRVQSENDFFQIFHLINLRKFFITQSFSFTFSSTDSDEAQIVSIASSRNFTFSKEYFANASSIVTSHFDYQSLQNLIQRNFDFLISILSRKSFKSISKHSTESSLTHVIQNSSISTEFTKSDSFDSNSKERSQANDNVHSEKKISRKFLFTTSQQLISRINFFFSFSILSFDSLFHQFRSSFSSNSFITSVRSISSSKLSANLHKDLDFSRIEKLNECIAEKISSKISSNHFSNNIRSTTSIMSILDENVSFSFVFNLTQQNIQEIALFMFNLFAQNVQSQTQTRATKTINETIINIAKKNVFRAFDVKFFDSQLDLSYDQDDVVQIRRKLYYKDVYLFVERVKDAVIMSEAEIVRTNLSTCLRESAQI